MGIGRNKLADKWEDEVFYYSVEGTLGDMTYTRGKKSIRDHHVDDNKLFLFQKTKKSGFWTFVDEFNYTGYQF